MSFFQSNDIVPFPNFSSEHSLNSCESNATHFASSFFFTPLPSIFLKSQPGQIRLGHLLTTLLPCFRILHSIDSFPHDGSATVMYHQCGHLQSNILSIQASPPFLNLQCCQFSLNHFLTAFLPPFVNLHRNHFVTIFHFQDQILLRSYFRISPSGTTPSTNHSCSINSPSSSK